MRVLGLSTMRAVVRDRRAFAFVCLLLGVFLLQTAVTRGHVHTGLSPDAAAAHALAGDIDGGGGTKKPLPEHDESQCPLWHASGICGAAVAADAVVLALPAPVRSTVAGDERTIFPERFAAAWRSRGPPSV
jgi:hypothetical protein